MKDQQINNIESQTSNLTTEEFHKLLADNTAELNKLRMFYAEQLAKCMMNIMTIWKVSSHRSIRQKTSFMMHARRMRKP